MSAMAGCNVVIGIVTKVSNGPLVLVAPKHLVVTQRTPGLSPCCVAKLELIDGTSLITYPDYASKESASSEIASSVTSLADARSDFI